MKILRQAGANSFSGNAFLIFLIRFFPSLANAVVIILFSHQLSQDVYGTYQNFWVQLLVLNTLACLGFQAYIITYSPGFVATILRRLHVRYYRYFFSWIILCAALFAALQLWVNHVGALVSFLFFIVYALSVIAEAVLISFRKFGRLLIVNLLHTLAFILVHFLFVFTGYPVIVLFSTLLILAVGRLFFLVLPAIRNVQKEELQVVDVSTLQKARNLWMHIGVYDVSQMLFKWIDKFIISLLLAKELSALYFNGSVDIPFLPLLLGAAGSSALMQLAHRKDEDSISFSISLINHSSRLLSSVVFPVFWFLFFYRTELFNVLLSEKYLPAIPIFLMSIMALPLRAYSFTTILQNRHKGAIINTGAILDLLLACSLMYPLYKLMGLPGVALSFVISSYLQGGFYLYHTSRVLQVGVGRLMPFGNLLLKFIVFAFLFIVIHYLSVRYFTQQIVLFSGMLLAIAMAALTLLLEYKATRK